MKTKQTALSFEFRLQMYSIMVYLNSRTTVKRENVETSDSILHGRRLVQGRSSLLALRLFAFALRTWHNLYLRTTMKSCNTVSQSISLTSLLGSFDNVQKTTPHSKRKISLKPRFGHRHEACNCTVNRVNALVAVRSPSSGDDKSSHQAFDSLDLQLQDVCNDVLVKKENVQDQSSPPMSQDVLKIGRDRDTPLSKLLDAFIDKVDGDARTKASQCPFNIDDDKELEMSLCSVDMDVFPLGEEDANFGLSFTDLLGHSSTTLDFNVQRRKVKFAPEKDTVVEIPSHRMLTEQEKVDMYNTSDAIRLQAFRNYAEWVWEGCDIANVVEEDKFCTDSDGNLLHPAHWVDENRPLANIDLNA